MSERLIGMLLFPRMTQLDLTGPYEVFARLPNTRVSLVAHRLDPVETDRGLVILPNATYADSPQVDVIVVPGGPGQQDLMDDAPTLAFLRRQAEGAAYVTSVCTGSLVLGAAGLLEGRRATCHWGAIDLLSHFGAMPTRERIVFDGRIITAAGVASGIDFALALAARLDGETVAREIQLHIEYDPAPPFDSGSPRTAAPDIVERVKARGAKLYAARADTARRAGEKIGQG